MYFKNIGSVSIDIDGSGNLDLIKNLSAKAKISDALLNNAGYYQTIKIIDGERPDHLSQRLYNTDQYHWTFLLLNPQIKNIWDDWPMSSSQLVEYCTNKYQYLAGDTDTDLNNKFIIGETVTGGVSGATGIVKEIIELSVDGLNRTVRVAISKPKNRAPASPIYIFAGLLFQTKKPRVAPAVTVERAAIKY